MAASVAAVLTRGTFWFCLKRYIRKKVHPREVSNASDHQELWGAREVQIRQTGYDYCRECEKMHTWNAHNVMDSGQMAGNEWHQGVLQVDGIEKCAQPVEKRVTSRFKR